MKGKRYKHLGLQYWVLARNEGPNLPQHGLQEAQFMERSNLSSGKRHLIIWASMDWVVARNEQYGPNLLQYGLQKAQFE